MEERKTIYLCLSHMSEDGMEQKICQRGVWHELGGADGSLQAARGQARIESYEQMLELIDLAKKDGFFD